VQKGAMCTLRHNVETSLTVSAEIRGPVIALNYEEITKIFILLTTIDKFCL